MQSGVQKPNSGSNPVDTFGQWDTHFARIMCFAARQRAMATRDKCLGLWQDGLRVPVGAGVSMQGLRGRWWGGVEQGGVVGSRGKRWSRGRGSGLGKGGFGGSGSAGAGLS